VVIDLFAGTGAMSLEALSRGARNAVLVERRIPAAKLIEKTAAEIGLSGSVRIVRGDAFWWSAQAPEGPPQRCLVFFCPPYELFRTQRKSLIELCRHWVDATEPGSLFVLEADTPLLVDELPALASWDIRSYAPTIIAIGEKIAGDV
jgi:16S rRNA (guanine966-N2)-methyltransferase